MPDITKEILTAILKSIDEAIHVVDTDGKTIFYNEVAAKHDGLSVSEVQGKQLLTVFPSLNEKTSTLLKVIETKQPIYNKAQAYINFYGKKIETMNTTLPIVVDGHLIGAVEIAKDYTRLKELSERLVDIQNGYKKRKKTSGIKYSFDDLVSSNQAFLETINEARKLAKSSSPILVFGESGTGKELFVQGIHKESKRSSGPFIVQNCAAIPETLLESILFGTAKGSYTGAVDRPGLFELADGGTLFLDELHTMPVELQAKLLRVLEDGIVRRIGSQVSFSVDVRVVSAMNVHPSVALQENKLRPDLYYRLNVLTFELLPLRERQEDIERLTIHFINSFNQVLKKQVKGVSPGVMEMFCGYSWPGNVRELKHTIEYMMNISENTILTEADLPVILRNPRKIPIFTEEHEIVFPLREKMSEYEKTLIANALKNTNGNVYQAAKLLEIPRQTLQYKMKKYFI